MTKVFIDPGHNYSGGDTGAVGYGLKEQDISVKVGNKLRVLLEINGMEVKSSRVSLYDNVGDGSLNSSLSSRASQANQWGADLFISVHCNAANSKAYGAETYAYENGTKAYRLAECVQKRVVEETGRVNRGVKTASFAVLRNTNMPAILVETAFIDNYEDNKFLGSEEGQEKLAVGIAKGTCEYLGIDFKDKNEENGGLSMSQYEELVKKDEKQDEIINIMGAEIDALKHPTVYNTLEEVPEWARDDIKNIVDSGYLKGDADGFGLSEDMLRLLVINSRAGLYGNVENSE